MPRGRPACRWWIGILIVWGVGAREAAAELPANPPPIKVQKPRDPGTNAPHALDRSAPAPQDMKPPSSTRTTTRSASPAPTSNADLLAELRRQKPASETYPAAEPSLVAKIKEMAKAQNESFCQLLCAEQLDAEGRQILASMEKINFAVLKPQAVEITAGKNLKVLSCPARPMFGLKLGDLFGVRDEAKDEQYAVVGVSGETSQLLQVFDAQPLIDATFVAPGNRRRAAENPLKSLEFDRLDPDNEFAPDVLHYQWSGSTGRIYPPHRASHDFPEKGVGLILFRPGDAAEVTANLVPPGYYAFRFDPVEKHWGLVRQTFRATIDNTGRPSPFRFVLENNGEEVIIPPLEVMTFAVMQPQVEITYRRNAAASLAPITEKLKAGVWKVVSDPKGDVVRIDEDPQAGRELVDIRGPDRVIFRNPDTSSGPATIHWLKQDPKSDKVERAQRILDPGEATYILAQPYHTVNGAITHPSVLVEPPATSPQAGNTIPVYYDPGVYHFEATAAGSWSPPTRPDEFTTWIFQPKTSAFHFIDRTGAKATDGAPGPGTHIEVRQPIPIAIEYDPGDGQGRVRQPLLSSTSKDTPPGYVVALDPATNLLKLIRGTPTDPPAGRPGNPGFWEAMGRWLDLRTRPVDGK